MQCHLIHINNQQTIVYNSNREEAIDITTKYPNCEKMQKINLASEYLTDVKLEQLLSDYFTQNGTVVKYLVTPEEVDIGFICHVFDGYVPEEDGKVEDCDVIYYQQSSITTGFGFEGEYFDAMNNFVM